MSLLSLCQDVADYCGINKPTTVIGSTDHDARRMLAVAKAEIQSLARAHDWVVLIAEHTFNTASGTANYSLPSDFDHIINNTIWNRNETQIASGPVNPQVWQTWQSGFLVPVINDNWRIIHNGGTKEFNIEPTPTAIETIAFEYVQNTPVESSGGTAQATWQADTDVPRLDAYLIELGMRWRALSRYGFSFVAERLEYEEQVEIAKARDGGNKILSAGKSPRDAKTAAYTPETGYG